jgi:hypothetical protein
MLTAERLWPMATDRQRMRGNALGTWADWQPAGPAPERQGSDDVVG